MQIGTLMTTSPMDVSTGMVGTKLAGQAEITAGEAGFSVETDVGLPVGVVSTDSQELEVLPGDAIIAANVLDLVLAQLTPLSTSTVSGESGEISLMSAESVDVSQVQSNLVKVGAELGLTSQSESAAAFLVTDRMASIAQTVVSADTLAIHGEGEASLLGIETSSVMVEGSAPGIDNFDLIEGNSDPGELRIADPAGSRPSNGKAPKITPEQADLIAKLVLSDVKSPELDVRIKEILRGAGSGNETGRIGSSGRVEIPNPSLGHDRNRETPVVPTHANQIGTGAIDVVSRPASVTVAGSTNEALQGHRLVAQDVETSASTAPKSEASTASVQDEDSSSISKLKEVLTQVKGEITRGIDSEAPQQTASILVSADEQMVKDRLLSRGTTGQITSNLEAEELSSGITGVTAKNDSSQETEVGFGQAERLKSEIEVETETGTDEISLEIDQDLQAKPSVAPTQVERKTIDNHPSAVTVTVGEISEVVKEVSDIIAARNPGKVEVKLMPEDLGTINVSVHQRAGHIEVDMKATDERVQQTLNSGRAELVQHLEGKGIVVSSVRVDQDLQGFNTSQNRSQQDHANRQDFERAMNLNQRYSLVESSAQYSPRSLTPTGVNYLV